MYDLPDTIAAVSSPGSDHRVIVRISGSNAVITANKIFQPEISPKGHRLISGHLRIDDELSIDAELYVFLAPHSYTGQNLVEIHYFSCSPVT
ncbi:MAG: hypothetical protein ACYTE8_12410, partial [Planctomycetota bacterium]